MTYMRCLERMKECNMLQRSVPESIFQVDARLAAVNDASRRLMTKDFQVLSPTPRAV